MNNAIGSVRSGNAREDRGTHHVAAELRLQPVSGGHVGQFYYQESCLFDAVARFVTGGIDRERIAPVITTLLDNPLTHGDPRRSVDVQVISSSGELSLSVHNAGRAIEPARLARLFDPPQRELERGAGARGLGVGRQIAEAIVAAHGGKLEVDSTSDTGTRSEIVLPRRA